MISPAAYDATANPKEEQEVQGTVDPVNELLTFRIVPWTPETTSKRTKRQPKKEERGR